MVWVVKLGGSLAFSPVLRLWLEALAAPSRRALVVVPGGGPFADQVRLAQQKHHFSDADAHRMAILATEQYGRMLAILAPRLAPAATVDEIDAVQGRGRVPVWMPARMTAAQGDIPAGWHVTSDSLAAWLAGALAADLLVLVKSVTPPRPAPGAGVPVGELERSGLIDGAFAAFAAGGGYEVRWMGAEDHRDMARALAGGPGALEMPGVRVTVAQPT